VNPHWTLYGKLRTEEQWKLIAHFGLKSEAIEAADTNANRGYDVCVNDADERMVFSAHGWTRSPSDRPTMRDIGGDAEDSRLRESGRLHRDR
jgi:hypothetical protein